MQGGVYKGLASNMNGLITFVATPEKSENYAKSKASSL